MIDFEQVVDKHLKEKNDIKRAEHETSGFLSASRLDKSTLENVLYLIGVPPLELTPYSLKVFARGESVEDWLVNILDEEKLLERSQTQLEYTTPNGSKIVGVEDVRLKDEDFPTEIKSIKNSAFKYLDTEGAKLGHILQACMYALAEGKSQARVLYVAADDYRTKSFIINVADYRGVLHRLADKVYSTLKEGVLPEFKPLTEFQELELYKDYTAYPEWFGEYGDGTVKGKRFVGGTLREYNRKARILTRPYTQGQLMEKLKNEYPEAYKKLQGFKETK